MTQKWVGRFAPTPSGPLHFGSLVAALGSYLIARQRQGQWLLRIEDIDPPREMPGAAQDILSTLEAFGFEWDGPVTYQSQRTAAYEQALDLLHSKSLVYQCDCSRKIVIERNDGVYDKYCRNRDLIDIGDSAIRIKFDPTFAKFNDEIFGHCEFNQQVFCQDFVVRRRDGLFAYQLAVVVDDIDFGINHIVRGADILDSTPRQNFLYHCFDKSAPSYFHLPLVTDESGHKYSKSKFFPAVEPAKACEWILKAYIHLGQKPPETDQIDKPDELLNWAVSNFELNKISKQPIAYPTDRGGEITT
ncbi:tRNA glutamyl-Q(34) synthetase GluQRS [Aliikangiella marina]|uniref:Glutamyl-Q tRNA(Asp) synthetase n=1 Tax=Aliikangiella marina TaxID=1712262 RepID=A0A545TCD8_9GAMM|nr:tRNA glutamyl-Q(34) synthetase GluQRS [Aliikangiella marina]TQV74880.1 tRNA glutamyl-Q(34) synthetase GluQRS [Aliikangiella marina]